MTTPKYAGVWLLELPDSGITDSDGVNRFRWASRDESLDEEVTHRAYDNRLLNGDGLDVSMAEGGGGLGFGIQPIEQLRVNLDNIDNFFSPWLTTDIRGNRARISYYDKNNNRKVELWRGEVGGVAIGDTVELELVGEDFASLRTQLPKNEITSSEFLFGTDLGKFKPLIFGIRKKIPGFYIHYDYTKNYYDYLLSETQTEIDYAYRDGQLLEEYFSNTPSDGTTNTLYLASARQKPDDYYNGWFVEQFHTPTDGATVSNAGYIARISDYDGTNNMVTIDGEWPFGSSPATHRAFLRPFTEYHFTPPPNGATTSTYNFSTARFGKLQRNSGGNLLPTSFDVRAFAPQRHSTLVADYTFNKTLRDMGSNGWHIGAGAGTYGKNAWVPGITGHGQSAIDFNGTRHLTVVGRAEFDVAAGSSLAYEIIFKKTVDGVLVERYNAGGTDGYQIGLSAGKLQVITKKNGNADDSFTGTTTLQNDTWYHAFIIFDLLFSGSSRPVYIYLNGILDGLKTTSNFGAITGDLKFGDSAHTFIGVIDTIRIYQTDGTSDIIPYSLATDGYYRVTRNFAYTLKSLIENSEGLGEYSDSTPRLIAPATAGANIIGGSNQFNDSIRWLQSGSPTFVSFATEDPFGAKIAMRVNKGTGTTLLSHNFFYGSSVSSIDLVGGVWVKAVSGSGTVTLTLTHILTTSKQSTIDSDRWYFIHVSHNDTSPTTNGIFKIETDSDVYLCHAQVYRAQEFPVTRYDARMTNLPFRELTTGGTFIGAAKELDDIGSLYCDAELITPQDFQSIAENMLMPRRMTLGKNGGGDWEVKLDRVKAITVADLGNEDAYGFKNITELGPYRRTPVSDAVKTLKLGYRVDRDLDEKKSRVVQEARFFANRSVLTKGEELEIINPFIREHLTADKTVEFLGKHLVAMDQSIEVGVDEEAVTVLPRDKVSLTVSRLNLDKAGFSVGNIAHSLKGSTLTLISYQSNKYTYDGATLNEDTFDDTIGDIRFTPPATPSSFSYSSQSIFTSSDGVVSVELTYNVKAPKSNVKGVKVYARKNGVSSLFQFIEEVSINPNETVSFTIRHKIFVPGLNYDITVTTVSPTGIESVDSLTDSNRLIDGDTTAPDSTGMAIASVAKPAKVMEVTITPPTTIPSDFKEYKIWRQTNTSPPSASSTPTVFTQSTVWQDTGVGYGSTYYYFVAVVDLSGNISSVVGPSSGKVPKGVGGVVGAGDIAGGSIGDADVGNLSAVKITAGTLTITSGAAAAIDIYGGGDITMRLVNGGSGDSQIIFTDAGTTYARIEGSTGILQIAASSSGKTLYLGSPSMDWDAVKIYAVGGTILLRGQLLTDQYTSTGPTGSSNGKIPIYNHFGSLQGYLKVFDLT